MITYLGDSVYATYLGWAIQLTTDNGPAGPTSTIILEPETLAALLKFVENVKKVTDDNR